MRRLAFAALLALATQAGAQQVSLAIEGLDSPDFTLRGVTATLTAGKPAQLVLQIDSITLGGEVWRNARVGCTRLSLGPATIECTEGALDLGEPIPLAFVYQTRTRTLEAVMRPAAGESWRLNARFGDASKQLEVNVVRGRLARLARWLPAGLPRVSAGVVSGTVALRNAGAVSAELAFEELAFSDSAGLRAGENIGAALRFAAERADRADRAWHWQGSAEWRAGEVFWQPVYLKANRQAVDIKGEYSGSRVRVEHARLQLPGLGVAEVGGAAWDLAANRLLEARIDAQRLSAAEVYAQLLKPFFAGTALSELRAGGEASLALEVRDGELHAVELELAQVSIEDRERRFALFGASGRIPWRRDAETTAQIALQGGEILKLPFGEFRLPLVLHGRRFSLERVSVPLLGGALTVSDFAAARDDTGWRWRFSGELTPVSVAQLTQSAGLATMHGTLSGVIPQVRYERSTLSVGGALVFNVFDGTVTARKAVLNEPLGRAPRFTVDLDMRNLDLDLLTRTFSFGSMTGRVDATVAGLELVNWQPVRFDARIASSPGDYRRTISQTAVQNISALGGAGAATAIQRSVLRFFDRFGYEKLGLSCVLRNEVCTMSGVEEAPQGSGYVIVKGGGIPALSVIGYNRQVSWTELVGRLKRIMQENVRAVIQ